MFMLFAFDGYYPSGGMNDWRATFSDMEDFQRWGVSTEYDHYQIFDTRNGNKSSMRLYQKIQEIEAIEPIGWDEEEELRRKLVNEFVKNFIEE